MDARQVLITVEKWASASHWRHYLEAGDYVAGGRSHVTVAEAL